MHSSPVDRLDKLERTHLNKVSEPGLGATQVLLKKKKKKIQFKFRSRQKKCASALCSFWRHQLSKRIRVNMT